VILPDHTLHDYCSNPLFASRAPLVVPYRPQNVQPASIDVCLGRHFKVFEPHDEGVIDLADPVDITKEVERDRFVLHPGEFVLGCTDEIVNCPNDIVGRVEGKSSLGRLGLIVHATAGFIDPGFSGVVTLEMANLMRVPIVLHAGQLIAQISFQQMLSAAHKPYQGHYQGDMNVASSRFGEPITTRGE
jgi:dCTP deaminase